MVNIEIPLHQGDNIVLSENFDFSQSIFDLPEPIPSLSGNFFTPIDIIKKKFENYDNLLKLGHVNACSVPKHLHEIERILMFLELVKHLLNQTPPKQPLIFQDITFFMLTEPWPPVGAWVCILDLNTLQNSLSYQLI